jgi:phosphatidate phosphatase APP1
VALPNQTATLVTVNAKPSATNVRTLRASATDTAGNTSAWSTGDPWRLRVIQDGTSSIAKAGTWKSASSSNYYGGTVRFALASGASQQITANVTNAAIVLSKGPRMGKVKLWVDGYEQTFDLYSATAKYRIVLWTADFGPSPAIHTIRLTATGTKNPASGGTRVELDAFLLIGP